MGGFSFRAYKWRLYNQFRERLSRFLPGRIDPKYNTSQLGEVLRIES